MAKRATRAKKSPRDPLSALMEMEGTIFMGKTREDVYTRYFIASVGDERHLCAEVWRQVEGLENWYLMSPTIFLTYEFVKNLFDCPLILDGILEAMYEKHTA